MWDSLWWIFKKLKILSFTEPNKKIETLLQEMKKQLTRVEDDINILKANKTSVKGKNKYLNVSLGVKGFKFS